ncbi:DUF6917 domain-containing protein [Thermodesulfobacteriota bacterium]
MKNNKKDPYISSDIYENDMDKTKRRPVKGHIISVCSRRSEKRGLRLIPHETRALCKHEIHELVTTDEINAGPNKTVNKVAIVCFFEITQGSTSVVGSPVFINNKKIGEIAGFDDTHFPNHYNIVVISPQRFTGIEAILGIGDKISIGIL